MTEKYSTFSPAMIFLLLTVLIDAIGLGIIIPVMPSLIMDIAHVNLAMATQIGSLLYITYSGFQFLFSPFFGNVSDRFGRRPLILLSLLCFSLSYAVMGLSASLGWIFVLRMAAGIAGSVYTAAMACVADLTPPEKRAGSFGLVGAAIGLGFIVGPTLGGLLGEINVRLPFFVAAFMGVANFGLGFFALRETLPEERRRPFSLARANPVGALLTLRSVPMLGTLAIILFLSQMAAQVYSATWSYYGIAAFGWTEHMIGLSLALLGVMIAVVQGGLARRAVALIGEYKTAMLGVGAASLAFLAHALAGEAWMAFTIIVLGAMQWLVSPALVGLMSKSVGASRQGEIQGVSASLNSLAAVLGPLAMAQTFAFFNRPAAPFIFPGAAFILASAIALLCFLILVLSRRRYGAAAK